MKGYKPVKPDGDTPFALFVKWIWDLLANGKFPIRGVGGIKVQYTEGYYQISGGSGAAGAAGSFAIRGEYSPSVTYKLYDVTVISSGINQGTFVCIAPTAYNVAPYTGGGYWMQLPGGLLGVWM